MLNSGPPELPGLIDVSIWMQSVYSSSSAGRLLVAVHAADQAEVTVGVKSVASRNGLPIASDQSPGSTLSLSPSGTKGNGLSTPCRPSLSLAAA